MSSIVNEVIKTISSLFIFFYKNISSVIKEPKHKIKNWFVQLRTNHLLLYFVTVHKVVQHELHKRMRFYFTAQKMKFSIKYFFCKYVQIFLWIWSHLLKKSIMERFIFCTGSAPYILDYRLKTKIYRQCSTDAKFSKKIRFFNPCGFHFVEIQATFSWCL